MVDRAVRALEAGEDRRVRFSDWLDAPNIVLLGDPGAGKSHLFRAFAPKGALLRARDFLNTPLDALRGRSTWFIDALDEKRVSRSDANPVDDLVHRLLELKPQRVRIACRAADWLGSSDLGAFGPYFDISGGVTVLSLEALTDNECAEILTTRGCADPSAFLEEARVRGVEDLLGNPQNLTMLYDVVQSRRWPHTRSELYASAVSLLLTEHNPEHRRKDAGAFTANELLLPAGAVCAARLIADVSGISLTSADVGGDYPSYRDLRIYPHECVLAALTRRVFVSTGSPETVDYGHRTIAEYLAAQFLVQQIRGGLPFGRVRALISVDGHPSSELRGLHAWLAVLLPEHAPNLIAADPFGVLSYGDAASMTSEHRIALMQALSALANQDPWFRHGSWSAALMRGLAGPDLEDPFRAILRQSDASQSLMSIVLDAVCVGTPLPALKSDLLDVLGNSDRTAGQRIKALNALLHMGPNAHEDCRAAYSVLARKGAELQFRALCLMRLLLYGLADAAEIAQLLNDAFSAPRTQPISGGLQDFDQRIPDGMVRTVLDQVALQQLPQGAHDSYLAREAFAVIDGLLGRLLDAAAVDTEYVVKWLLDRNTSTRYFHSFGHQDALRKRLKADPARLHTLLDVAVTHINESTRWGVMVRLGQIFIGAVDDACLLAWSLQKIRRSIPSPDSLCYEIALHSVFAIGPIERENFEFLFDAVNGNEECERIRDACCCSPIPDWRIESSTRRQEDAAQRAADLARDLAEFDSCLEAIRAGLHLSWLAHLSRIYFSLYIDTDPKIGPRERLVAVVGLDRMEQTLAGLRALVASGRTSTVEEILQLHAAEKMHRWWYAIIAGLDEYVVADGDLDLLRLDYLCSAVVIDLIHPTWEQMDSTRNVMHHSWVTWFAEHQPEAYCSTLMQLVRFELARNAQHVYGFIELMRLPKKMLKNCAMELLATFPTIDARHLLQLLSVLVKSDGDRAGVKALIIDGIGLSKDHPDAFAAWLSGALSVDFAAFKPLADAQEGADARKALLWASRDLVGLNRGAEDAAPTPIAYTEYMFILAATCFQREAFMAGESVGDRQAWDATQYTMGLLNNLAADVSDEARDSLQRCLISPAAISYRADIKHAIAEQFIRRVDAEYRQPTWTATLTTLSNGAPASIADLHALVLDQLRDIQVHISNGSTDLFKRFWNETSYGGLDSPKPENSGRHVLVDELRKRLQPHGIRVEPEGHMSHGKRVDIAVYADTMKLVIELKRHYHDEVWTAASEQLERFYVRDPESRGYGIYGVFWFGVTRPTPARPGLAPKPRSAEEMLKALKVTVPHSQHAKIACVVLDVSGEQ